jgi:hypothetical protein
MAERNHQNPGAGAPKQSIGDLSIPGLGIYPGGEDSPWPLVIKSSTPREDWKTFRPLSVHERERGGTTLIYQDRAYRIDEAGVTRAGVWTYRLKPWPEGEPWHRVVRLTAADMAREAAEKQAFAKARHLEQISIYYEFLLGFLPARIQNQLAQRMRFSPEHASRKNAYLQFLVFLVVSMFMTAAIWAAGLRGGSSPLIGSWMTAFLSVYLMIEGFVRWGHIQAKNEPCGLFLLEACDWLYQRLSRRLRRNRQM